MPLRVVVAATVLALLAAGGVLWFLSDDASGDAATPDESDGTLSLSPADEIPTGDPLGITFAGSDGSDTTLGDQLGDTPTVVNFFAHWCPPCVDEMPDFEAVAQDLQGQVSFYGLAVQDRPEDAQAIVADTGVSYPWGRDTAGDVLAAVGGVQMPTTVFIDAEGTIVEVHSGALDADELAAAVAENLGVIGDGQ